MIFLSLALEPQAMDLCERRRSGGTWKTGCWGYVEDNRTGRDATLGPLSTLVPLEEGKRRGARREGGGFKRAGWADLDETIALKKSRGRVRAPSGRGRGGRGRGVARRPPSLDSGY